MPYKKSDSLTIFIELESGTHPNKTEDQKCIFIIFIVIIVASYIVFTK